MKKLYDESSPVSIETYGKQMVHKTFREIYDAAMWTHIISDEQEKYGGKHTPKTFKGKLGNLVEECYFEYRCNSDSNPDFEQAGVELKVTPYKKNQKGKLSAKERLILTMIDYMEIVKETSFEYSHVWQKSKLILLVWYLYEKDKPSLDFKINFVKLFTPPLEDRKIIESDYKKIVAKIRDGKAHELSEGDTLYLGAATKASSSKVRRKQPHSNIEAKPRAFSYKNSYMTYVLNYYIIPNKTTYERIANADEASDFETFVTSKIEAYRGWTVAQLCKHFGIQSKAKNLMSILAFRILGVKGNNAEEFEKANIVVKSIRINRNDKIRESMSFPVFKFNELVHEDWEDSTFGNYLRDTRFFFVIYHENSDGEYVLMGSQFWNIPYHDLEYEVHHVWEETKRVLENGLKIEIDKNGNRRNNFPKKAENPVSHVRPHARNGEDTDTLPDGRKYPKQCFWLNNTYILSQLKPELVHL